MSQSISIPEKNQVPLLLRILQLADKGSLDITLPNGDHHKIEGALPGISAVLRVHRWNFFPRLLMKGDIGLAETYRDGLWETDDLPALVQWATENEDRLERLHKGNPLVRLSHGIKWAFEKRNTRRLSRKNIHRHYDLGNSFFQLWLDRTMTYSSAWFEGDYSKSLEEAQRAKYRRILTETGLKPGSTLLEIGCGWGGFAEEAARQGYPVTSITISEEQFAYARDQINQAGLSDLAEVRFQDYRDVTGQFDGVVSIEMIEAVGPAHWDSYFRKIQEVLKPGGTAVIQGITIKDELLRSTGNEPTLSSSISFRRHADC